MCCFCCQCFIVRNLLACRVALTRISFYFSITHTNFHNNVQQSSTSGSFCKERVRSCNGVFTRGDCRGDGRLRRPPCVLYIHYINVVAVVERIKITRTPFYRPPLPQQEAEGVHPEILSLMKQCWAEEPSERPSFDEIGKTLKFINKGKSA